MDDRELANAKEEYEADGFYPTPETIIPEEVVGGAIRGMDAVRAGHYDTGIPII